MNLYQYYCTLCGYEREGLLDSPAGIGGYSTTCPQCSGFYWSYIVEENDDESENY